MKVTLKTISPDIENIIIEIARVSSSRVDKTENPAPLINHLIKNKHWSPFEHGSITMEIVTSKAIGIQLLRHRSFTFQEFSQRYAVVDAIEPIELRQQHKNNRQSSTEVFDPEVDNPIYPHDVLRASDAITEFMEHSQTLYKTLLSQGVARECARMVLPMATQTTIFMTGTVRSWIHLLDIRDDSHAQLEVQLIAKEMKRIFKEQCPLIAEARGWKN